MSDQEKRLFLSSGPLISIGDAAKGTPYSQEYLSLLARKGRLKAVKISRDWLTTRQAVLAYLRAQEQKHKRILASLERSGRRVS
jgi:hypothetical protein